MWVNLWKVQYHTIACFNAINLFWQGWLRQAQNADKNYAYSKSQSQSGAQEASQTWGHDTSRARFSLRRRGHVLNMKRALLCLLKNLGGGHVPPVPPGSYVSEDSLACKKCEITLPHTYQRKMHATLCVNKKSILFMTTGHAPFALFKAICIYSVIKTKKNSDRTCKRFN